MELRSAETEHPGFFGNLQFGKFPVYRSINSETVRKLQCEPMPTIDDVLFRLVQSTESVKLSIYAPMLKLGGSIRQNQIRWSLIIKEARASLRKLNLENDQVEQILAPAKARLEQHEFWRGQRKGLAMFLSEKKKLTIKLPFHVNKVICLSNEFFTGPLILNKAQLWDAVVLTVRPDTGRLDRVNYAGHERLADGVLGAELANALDVSGCNDDLISFSENQETDLPQSIQEYFRKLGPSLNRFLEKEGCDYYFSGSHRLLSCLDQNCGDLSFGDSCLSNDSGHPDAENFHQEFSRFSDSRRRSNQIAQLRELQRCLDRDCCTSNLGELLQATRSGELDKLFVSDATKAFTTDYSNASGRISNRVVNEAMRNRCPVVSFDSEVLGSVPDIIGTFHPNS